MVDKMLLTNARCVTIVDRRCNTVPHVARRSGSSLQVIQHLCIMFPDSLRTVHATFSAELLYAWYIITSAYLIQWPYICWNGVTHDGSLIDTDMEYGLFFARRQTATLAPARTVRTTAGAAAAILTTNIAVGM